MVVTNELLVVITNRWCNEVWSIDGGGGDDNEGAA